MTESKSGEQSPTAFVLTTNALAEIIGESSYRVIMPFRFGYPTMQPTAPAPSRNVEAILI
jgi:hypothetical protein